jgi:hypothetical protein
MRTPAKFAFSAKYSEYGIWGAKGLVDHGTSEELDMAQACAAGGKDFCGRRAKGGRGIRDEGKNLGGSEAL